jgi:aspartyl/asparaginyl beta-hydroxylase (cupin superfamily)
MGAGTSNEAAQANRLGLESLRSGDARTAAAHFQRACDADPEAGELRINLAAAHRLLGDASAERAALEQALDIDRLNLMAEIRLAQLHERLHQPAPATRHWNAVLSLGSSISEPSPDLEALLSHARAYVDAQGQELEGRLQSALADGLARASTRDRRRVSAAADVMLGRRTIFANECHGLHYPFLPADEFFDREHFPWLDTLEAETGTIRAELEAILGDRDPGLAPYVEQPSGVPENKWSPLDRSLDWGALHLWRDGERNEAACARAPKTAVLVETLPLCRIPGRAPAVFFSILKAGKRIPPHTGVTNVRSIVHLPLIVPDGCTFRVGSETRAWVEGEAFVFDDTIEHEALNPTDHDRAVLILDVWNPYLSEAEREMICTIYAVTTSEPMRAD